MEDIENCFNNVTDLTRIEKLKIWMDRNEVTLKMLAPYAGVCVNVLSRSLRNETMPTEQYNGCVAFGLPPSILPLPKDKKPGPKPKVYHS